MDGTCPDAPCDHPHGQLQHRDRPRAEERVEHPHAVRRLPEREEEVREDVPQERDERVPGVVALPRKLAGAPDDGWQG